MRSSYKATAFPRRGASSFSRRRTPFATDSPRNLVVATEACASKMAAALQQVQSLSKISLTSPGAPAPTSLCGPDDPIEACRTQTRKGDVELGEKLLCQLCNAFHVAHQKEPDDRVESAWALNYPLDKVHEAFMTGEDHIMCTETCGQDFEAASATILDALLCKLQHDGATAKCALEKYRRLVEDYRCCEAELKHCAPGPNRARLSQDRKNAHKKAHQVWCSVFGPLRLSRQVLAGPGVDGSFTQTQVADQPGTGRYRPCVTRGYLYNLATFVAKNLLVRNEREVLRLCRTDMLQSPFSMNNISDPCACPTTADAAGGTTPASVSDAAMVREIIRLWGMDEEPFKKKNIRTIGQALQALLGSQACSFGAEQLFKSAGACPSGPDGPYSAFRRCFDTWRPGLGCHTPEDDARARKYLLIFADPLKGALGYYLSFCQKFAAAIGDSLHCVGEYPDPVEHNSSMGSSSSALGTAESRAKEVAYKTWIGQLSSLVGKYQLNRTTCSNATEFWKDVMDDLRTGLMQGVVGHHVRRAGSAGRHAWAVQFDCELGRIAEKTNIIGGDIKKTDGKAITDAPSAAASVEEADRESKVDRLFFIPYRNVADTANHGNDEKEWRKKNKRVKRARQLVQRQWHPCLMDAAHVEDHLVFGKTLGHHNPTKTVGATQSNLFKDKLNVFADNRYFYPGKPTTIKTTTFVESAKQTKVPRDADTDTTSGLRSDWRPRAVPREAADGTHFSTVGSVNGAHFAATLDLGLRDAKVGEYLAQWARTNQSDRDLAWGGNGAVQCFYTCLIEKTTKKEAREHFRTVWKKQLQDENSQIFKELTTTVLAQVTNAPTDGSADTSAFVALLEKDTEFKKAVGATSTTIVAMTPNMLDETKQVWGIFDEVIKSMEEHGLDHGAIKSLVGAKSSTVPSGGITTFTNKNFLKNMAMLKYQEKDTDYVASLTTGSTTIVGQNEFENVIDFPSLMTYFRKYYSQNGVGEPDFAVINNGVDKSFLSTAQATIETALWDGIKKISEKEKTESDIINSDTSLSADDKKQNVTQVEKGKKLELTNLFTTKGSILADYYSNVTTHNILSDENVQEFYKRWQTDDAVINANMIEYFLTEKLLPDLINIAKRWSSTPVRNISILQLAVERAVDTTTFGDEKFEKFMEHCVAPVLKNTADRDCVLQDLRTMRADQCADDPNDPEIKDNIVKIDRAIVSKADNPYNGAKVDDTAHPDDLSWKDFAVTLNKWTPADHCRSSFVHSNLCPAEMANDKSQRILFAKVFNMLEGSIKKGMFRTAASVLAQTAKENSCGLGDDSELWA